MSLFCASFLLAVVLAGAHWAHGKLMREVAIQALGPPLALVLDEEDASTALALVMVHAAD